MTVTITTAINNELVTYELTDVSAIIKDCNIVVFVRAGKSSVSFNYSDITFSTR